MTTLSTKYNITYVSAYFTLKKTPYFTKSHKELWEPEAIIDIVSLGVPFCLYIGKECEYEQLFREWETVYPNFKVMPYRVDYRDTFAHRQCVELLEDGIPVSLPEKRNREKDTYEYMVYMNSRVELMEDAISENWWNTTHYAWIDFYTSKLFRQKGDTLDFLQKLSVKQITPQKLTIPGCWPKLENINTIAQEIYWRFCGGFFVGDVDSIRHFGILYRAHFTEFLKKYRSITWEVNFWAYLEYKYKWNPVWYKGDHDDSIVNVSADMYTLGLDSRIQSCVTYSYPEFPEFHSGSASYLFHGGKHLLNTRYVSYWIYPNGYYKFYNADRTISNRNIVSELNDHTMLPKYYREMGKVYNTAGEEFVPPPKPKPYMSEGLEDIRLYSLGDTIRFIATTFSYAENDRPRIMVGTYSVDTLEYRDCMVIRPPTDTSCEKNWIPLPKYNQETREWEEWFVYKWHPFELGKVYNGVLHIEKQFQTNTAIFNKVRGSTTFTDYGDGKHLVGLVHSSEEHAPRHYYHMLVLLDKETFEPKQYSNTFCFYELSIEFCIGMACNTNTQMYTFWISRFDRSPIMLTVRMSDIPLMCL